ncbi:MAG: cytochrome P450, partial [Gammaproteobacteria bacterium]
MPEGQAYDMGHAEDGTPLIDPRIFDSPEFFRNPYPYYRILRDHYPVFHDKLHNCYWVTRYDDITECYFDDEGFNTIPKGSSSGVLGNTQLELSGVEHRRRRNLYGQHLVGQSLNNRIPAIERLADEMIDDWDKLAAASSDLVQDNGDRRTIELGQVFANEFPIRVVCEVLGFPKESQSQFYYWYNSMMTGLGGSDTHKQGVEARQDLEDYIAGIVEE